MKARRLAARIAALTLVLPIVPGAGATPASSSGSTPEIPPPCPGYQRIYLTPGSRESTARASNDHGQVVGTRISGPDLQVVVYLWDPRTGRQDLGPSAGEFAGDDEAVAINNRGQVTWAAPGPGGGTHAVVWTPGRGIRDLGTLGGTSSTPMDINDRGEVVGTSQTATGADHAFFWSPMRGLRDLGDLAGDDASASPGRDVPAAVNNRGQVVLRSFIWMPEDDWFTRVDHAWLWEPRTGRLVDIGPMDWQGLLTINNRGQVLVDSGVWDARTGKRKRLAWQPGFSATDLNERGEVVGAEPIDADGGAAVHWDTRTGRVQVTRLPYDSARAMSVNDHGLVAVNGVDLFDDWTMGTDLLWQPRTGRVCRLGEAGYYGSALLLDNRSTVAGWGYIDGGAYVWTRHR